MISIRGMGNRWRSFAWVCILTVGLQTTFPLAALGDEKATPKAAAPQPRDLPPGQVGQVDIPRQDGETEHTQQQDAVQGDPQTNASFDATTGLLVVASMIGGGLFVAFRKRLRAMGGRSLWGNILPDKWVGPAEGALAQVDPEQKFYKEKVKPTFEEFNKLSTLHKEFTEVYTKYFEAARMDATDDDVEGFGDDVRRAVLEARGKFIAARDAYLEQLKTFQTKLNDLNTAELELLEKVRTHKWVGKNHGSVEFQPGFPTFADVLDEAFSISIAQLPTEEQKVLKEIAEQGNTRGLGRITKIMTRVAKNYEEGSIPSAYRFSASNRGWACVRMVRHFLGWTYRRAHYLGAGLAIGAAIFASIRFTDVKKEAVVSVRNAKVNATRASIEASLPEIHYSISPFDVQTHVKVTSTLWKSTDNDVISSLKLQYPIAHEAGVATDGVGLRTMEGMMLSARGQVDAVVKATPDVQRSIVWRSEEEFYREFVQIKDLSVQHATKANGGKNPIEEAKRDLPDIEKRLDDELRRMARQAARSND